MQPTETTHSAGQILETLGLFKVRPITPTPGPAPSASAKHAKRQAWIAKWLPMTVTHPQINVAREAMHNFCSEMAQNPARGRLVILFGENGSGKTHLAKCVSRWFASVALQLPWVNDCTDHVRRPHRVFVNWAEAVDNFQKRQETGIFDALKSADLAILDDIGAEHDPSAYGREQLYLILNKREHRWTLITTNVERAHWDEKFERRIASRLFRNAEHIDFSRVPDFSAM